MTVYTRLAHTKMILHRWRRVLLALFAALLVAGCGFSIPTKLPVEIPGIPSDWGELQGLMDEWGIPDLSELGNVPGLESLGGLQTPPGAIAFQGPVEMALSAGQTIPGTDIRFVQAEAGASAAQFEISGLRAPRQLGDSLDFDGAWPGVGGVSYQLRLRVYQISNGGVRAAGVQRLVIANTTPTVANVNVESGGTQFRFPHSVTTATGETFPGMTLGYAGQDDRGATLRGLPDGEYPYRKMGDSVEWSGMLTPQIPVVYQLRVMYYQEANATVGGVVVLSLPGP